MKVYLSPQIVFDDEKFEYQFKDDIIIATLKINDEEFTDTFDFTNMPDGVLYEVETTLLYNPILEAEKKDGVLYIKLLDFIKENQYKPNYIPEWKEV